MRHTNLVLTTLLAAGIAVGCASTDATSGGGPSPRGSAAAQVEKAKTETKKAAQAMEHYVYAQKAEFVDLMKKDLAGIQEELDRLAAKVDGSSGAAKADAQTKLQALREKWFQTKQQLEQAESATESTWDDVMASFKTSYGELKASFDSTRQWLSDEIAP
jgi:predicted nucleic acid-binding protein